MELRTSSSFSASFSGRRHSLPSLLRSYHLCSNVCASEAHAKTLAKACSTIRGGQCPFPETLRSSSPLSCSPAVNARARTFRTQVASVASTEVATFLEDIEPDQLGDFPAHLEEKPFQSELLFSDIPVSLELLQLLLLASSEIACAELAAITAPRASKSSLANILLPSPANSAKRAEQEASSNPSPQDSSPPEKDWKTLGGLLFVLFLLSISYVHQSTTGFALPAMLPMISQEMGLTDLQGALLTTGFSYLYAAALLPVGILADKVDRPKMLAGGAALWSLLTIMAAGASNYGELIAARVGFAAAQAVQNPVCFSMIPELFPKNKSTALAAYNCAIYFGRALSFAAVIVAHQMSLEPLKAFVEFPTDIITTAAGYIMVPMDKVDLHLVSILYTSGDMVAVANNPAWNYWMQLEEVKTDVDTVAVNLDAWRDVLRGLALPGFGLSVLLWFVVKDPRTERQAKEKQEELELEQEQQREQQRQQQQQLQASPFTSFSASAGFDPSSFSSSLSASILGPCLQSSGTALTSMPTFFPEDLARSYASDSESDSSDSEYDAFTPASSNPLAATAALPSLSTQPSPPSVSRSFLPIDLASLPQLPNSSLPSLDPLSTINRNLPSSDMSMTEEDGMKDNKNPMANVLILLKNKPFMATTIAASLNDLSSYALIAWQSTFYERVYHIDSSVYAPVLAMVLPIGGIVGGVGGGWLADKLAKRGKRVWVTAGASLLASPFLLWSLTAETYESSFIAVMIGFALSEAWRAPSAVMAKSCAPASMGATSSALYLCVRNIVGGLGPLAVALMTNKIGLQAALYLVPISCLASGSVFVLAETFFSEKDRALLERTIQDTADMEDEYEEDDDGNLIPTPEAVLLGDPSTPTGIQASLPTDIEDGTHTANQLSSQTGSEAGSLADSNTGSQGASARKREMLEEAREIALAMERQELPFGAEPPLLGPLVVVLAVPRLSARNPGPNKVVYCLVGPLD
eukprot:gene18172-24604_t